MGYNLTIDQGNSAAKTAVWLNETLIAHNFHCSLSIDNVKQIIRQYDITKAIYSSVSVTGNEIIDALKKSCNKVIELSHKTPLPISIDYKTPETLGRDRIASAVGAKAIFPDDTVLVIDLGTAVTYDVITKDAHFKGGNIAPGLKMRLEAMHHYTKRLPLVEADCQSPSWGVDTATAMNAGAVMGIVGEITHYKSILPENTRVVLTGGVAQNIAELLDFKVTIEEHLVNKGLNCILQYNENK